jgi:hypothetical protein
MTIVTLSSAVMPIAAAVAAETGHRCAAQLDDAARLACYDAAFGRPGVTSAPDASGSADAASATVAVPAAVAAPAVAATAVPADPAADFGLSEQAIRARDPELAKITDPDQISATVASLGQRPRGELIFTLDNGQVWVQSEVDRRARLKVGDRVTVKKGALASYLLVTPSGVATRVKRTK